LDKTVKIEGALMELISGDGHKLSAYRVDPADAPKGAVVVVQEVFGVNSHIRKMADKFAAEGYVAIAPSLFDRVKTGVELGYDQAALNEGLGYREQIEDATALADIQAAVNAVGDVGKVAVVGFCWGGYLAYRANQEVRGLSCAVGYYGAGIEKRFLGKSRVPTCTHWAEKDPLIAFDPEVIQFRAYRPDVTAYSYPETTHGFNCDERDSYNAEAAAKAMERTLFFISQFLVGQAPVQLKNAGFYAQQKTVKKKKKKAAGGGDDMGPPDA
jgi:carboxymethylenebutenolidase